MEGLVELYGKNIDEEQGRSLGDAPHEGVADRRERGEGVRQTAIADSHQRHAEGQQGHQRPTERGGPQRARSRQKEGLRHGDHPHDDAHKQHQDDERDAQGQSLARACRMQQRRQKTALNEGAIGDAQQQNPHQNGR